MIAKKLFKISQGLISKNTPCLFTMSPFRVFSDLSVIDTSTPETIHEDLGLPYRLYGMSERPSTKVSYVLERVFSEHRLPKDMINSYLSKIFIGTLHAMADHDKVFLQEYLEENMANRLITSLERIRGKGYQLQVIDDVSGSRGVPIPSKVEYLDGVMIRGLSIKRSENGKETDYHVMNDIEQMGLVSFTPMGLTDPDDERFIDPKLNQKAYENADLAVARILVSVISPKRLKVVNPYGHEVQMEGIDRNWEHLVLFESQLKSPEKFKSTKKLEGYMEWLGKYRFGKWQLSDMDNWMLGNPLFSGETKRSLYHDPVFKGSKYDPEITIDPRNTH